MPLWKANAKNVWAKVDLSGMALNVDVILCAPGPSLIPVERQPGVMIAALTKAYPVIKPDFWFGMDDPACYDRALWAECFAKVVNGAMKKIKVADRLCCYAPFTYFADLNKRDNYTSIVDELSEPETFLWKQHTLGVALHVLMWMGARRIYLNGVDLRPTGGKDYVDGARKELTPLLRKQNQMLFNEQFSFIKNLAAAAHEKGIRIISCTPDSPLNKRIGYCDLQTALKAARARVPDPGIIMHCLELAAQKAGVPLPLTMDGIRKSLESAKAKSGPRMPLKQGAPTVVNIASLPGA